MERSAFLGVSLLGCFLFDGGVAAADFLLPMYAYTYTSFHSSSPLPDHP